MILRNDIQPFMILVFSFMPNLSLAVEFSLRWSLEPFLFSTIVPIRSWWFLATRSHWAHFMVEAATVVIFSLSVAFQAIPLAAMRTPAIEIHYWDSLQLRKMTYCQFLAINRSIFSQIVSFPWRDAHTEFEIGPRRRLHDSRSQVSRYSGAYILQMVRSFLVSAYHTADLLWRLNTKLEANDIPPMSSLVKDLSDGVRLIQLMVSKQSYYGFHLVVLRWNAQEIMGIVAILWPSHCKLIMSSDRRDLSWPI